MILTQIGIIVISIAVLIACIFLVSKFQNWFAKNRLILLFILLVLGMALYGFGYLIKYPDAKVSAVLMAIISTGRMLIFENDFEAISEQVAGIPYFNLLFSLCMSLTMLTVGMVALSYTGYRALCKIQLGFLRIFTFHKKIYVFSQMNERAMLLAKDIKKSQSPGIVLFLVPVVEEEEEKLLLEKEASAQGFLVIPSRKEVGIEIQLLFKGFESKQFYLFLIGEEMDNFSICGELEREHQKNGLSVKDLNSYVWIQNSEFATVLDQNKFSFMDIHCIHEEELCVRKYFSETTIREFRSGSNLRIGLIGWNDLAKQLLNYAIMLGQFQEGIIEITLVDQEIEDKSAMYFVQNPEIGKVASFRLVDSKESSKDFYQTTDILSSELDLVFYLNENIEVAATLSRRFAGNDSQCKFACYFGDKPQYQEVLRGDIFQSVQVFGDWQKLYTKDLIVAETLDCLAKSFHQFYASLYNDSRKWDTISLFEKQSNRALALSIQSKLYDLGLQYAKGDDITLFEEQVNRKEILEKLTLEEHLRWNAFYFVNGYATLDMNNSERKAKDTFAKKHVCLVSFEELLKVEAIFEKDYQGMDQYLVLQIGNVLKQAGFGIYSR